MTEVNIDQAVELLFNMVVQCKDKGEDRHVFLAPETGRPVRRAKEIGVALWTLGGSTAMHEVAHHLMNRVDAWVASGHKEAEFDLRQLDFCWNGIGEWQA